MTEDRFDRRQLLLVLGAVTVFALLLRGFALGWRVFHWDEARVGYWTLRYLETGVWEYRAVVHGPLLFHVNEFLFGTFGTSDALARTLVAIVGGLLPLTAWLFRSRLRDIEVIGLGVLLAIDPTLLYYSRFMRNDVLVAAFSLLAVGFAIRWLETRRNRYAYGLTLALGLAFGTKEIALVYLGIWGGALALLLDHRLFVARETGSRWYPIARDVFLGMYHGIYKHWRTIAVAVIEFVAIIVALYAPRPDLYQVLSNPGTIPAVLEAATIESAEKLVDMWIQGGHEHSYIAYLWDAVETTAFVSLPLVLFAVLGFLYDRYTGEEPRDVIAFAFYWGATVFIIYPAITDISSAWSIVHALVPLTIPAAVGVRLVVARGLSAWETDDLVGAGIAALVLLALVGQVGVVAYDTTYANPQDDENPLVQYGQPGGHLQDELAVIESIARTTEGTDVVWYGDHFAVSDETIADQYPANSQWLNRMPIAWYIERAGGTTASATEPSEIPDGAPVVIARVEHYGELADRMEGYDARTYEITATGTETIFFVDHQALNGTAARSMNGTAGSTAGA